MSPVSCMHASVFIHEIHVNLHDLDFVGRALLPADAALGIHDV